MKKRINSQVVKDKRYSYNSMLNTRSNLVLEDKTLEFSQEFDSINSSSIKNKFKDRNIEKI